MNIIGAIVAGVVGTVIISMIMAMAPRMGMPKMAIWEMLGSMFNKDGNNALGWVIHFMMGVIFAIIYAALWAAGIGSATLLNGVIFGVVHWMFPKYSKEKPRGDDRLSWTIYGLLNVGLILRAIAEPLIGENIIFGWMVAISSVLSMIAGWLFVVNTWGRVKEK